MATYQVTIRGAWEQRDEWAKAWDRFVMRTRASDQLRVMINELTYDLPAEYYEHEIQARASGVYGRISKVGVIFDRRSMYRVKIQKLTLRDTDDLLIIILRLPGGIEHAATYHSTVTNKVRIASRVRT